MRFKFLHPPRFVKTNTSKGKAIHCPKTATPPPPHQLNCNAGKRVPTVDKRTSTRRDKTTAPIDMKRVCKGKGDLQEWRGSHSSECASAESSPNFMETGRWCGGGMCVKARDEKHPKLEGGRRVRRLKVREMGRVRWEI
uniref:Uncharacterized protein n=1 Tax=Physcomitrium patens TaxID=3218 RepID=A0A2K1IYG5_PHYPA|nr:hypothetical protein PHYPA_024136 [Physcomitrium patens]